MTTNLESTTLKKKQRATNPMSIYDTLPQPLRFWISKASLPWSPKSCKRIWDEALRNGLSVNDTTIALTKAERKTLAQEKHRF